MEHLVALHKILMAFCRLGMLGFSHRPSLPLAAMHSLRSLSVNIADLLNKSRGEVAYTLIDADGAVGEATLASIRAIQGVLSARLI